MNKIYPWHLEVWKKLQQDSQRLPHALLLHGQAGIGKYDFALNLSRALLCSNPTEEVFACEACSSCNWFIEGNHPDFNLLSPAQEADSEDETVTAKKTKKKTQISVSQIRELASFTCLSSHRSDGVRIILIHPAEALNTASANALLKMLEEPSPGVVFILVSHQIQRLLPTILSRCHKIAMPIPNGSDAMAWLSTQGINNAEAQLDYLEGSPIKVMEQQNEFSQLKEVWRLLALGENLQPHIGALALVANSAEFGIIAIQKWLYDVAAMRLSKQIRYHTGLSKTFQELAEKVHLNRLFDLQKKADELRKLANHPLNHELQMESLLLEYTKIFQALKITKISSTIN
ncbi:MAG: DNA polymerase III subunit delta' [Methylotenera sp.]|nr:DNA polymerase III subunit delta' [Methylotenera sp.]